jgi:hypothetical protein
VEVGEKGLYMDGGPTMPPHLKKNLFFVGEEEIVIDQISRVYRPWVLILPHLGWGRVYPLLGIHHTLVWNRVFQHDWGWLLQVLLWGLLRGRQC